MTTPGDGNGGFEGPAGVLVAPLMARMNKDMESAALNAADPQDGMEILVLGCGPGVGLVALLERCHPARVVAVEPSRAMVASATRRLGARQTAAVTFVTATAAEVTVALGWFDLALAVNCHQLWEPRPKSTSAVGSVLRPGASLVSLTHTWAIEKRCPVPEWKEKVESDLTAAGFDAGRWSSAPYRSGPGLLLTAPLRSDRPSGLAYD